jgi:hypothetical protein
VSVATAQRLAESDVDIRKLTAAAEYDEFRQSIVRIGRFGSARDPDMDPNKFILAVVNDVLDGADDFFVLVAVLHSQVVGHLVATVYENYGKIFVCIHQWEMDHDSEVTDEQQQCAFALVTDWAKGKGASSIRAEIFESPARVRLFQSRFGFNASGLTTVRKEL